jgi:hypothetical protein
MVNEIFLLTLALLLTALLIWGFRTLPTESWQIAASVPLAKDATGHWHGLNLTYYGVFQASAYTLAVALLFVLMGAVGVPAGGTIVLAGVFLAVSVPAATLVARLVERKRATFTVGGAVFVAVLLGPWALVATNRLLGPELGIELPLAAALAATAIAYALGEGVGRLACVSFGCCYGKPLSRLSPRLRRLFARYSFVFSGPTKKIAYEGGLEGERVVPIQGMTAALFVSVALGGMALFLHGHYRLALGATFLATQAWRFLSETLRADYRGRAKKVSAYQVMALVGMLYMLALLPFLPAQDLSRADILAGLTPLWDPGLLLGLQGLWLAIFLHTGRSVVTGSILFFHVRREFV